MAKVPPGVMKSELYGLVGRSHTASGAELNDDINSPLEIANCELWLDASNGPMTSGYAAPTNGQAVATWQDSSGNSRHATVEAGTPTMSTAGGYNGKPGVSIGASCRMATPAFVTSAYGNAITVFCVSKEAATLHSSTKVKVSISTATFYICNIGTTNVRGVACNGLTGFTSVVNAAPTLGGIDYFSVGASSVRLSTDGFGPLNTSSAYLDSTAISAGSVPFTNGKVIIGGLTGDPTYDWPGTISEVIVYSRQLSSAEMRRVYNYLAGKYSQKTLTLLGNSLTSGTGSTGGASQIQSTTGTNIPSRLMASSIGSQLRIRSDAFSGRSAAQLLANTPDYSGVYGSGVGSITLVWEGTNSLLQTASAQAAYEALRTVCLIRRQFGRRVYIGTVTPAQGGGAGTQFEALQLVLNTMIRNNYTQFADGIIDFAADSRLSDPNNTTYFSADKIHLNDTGYQVATDLIVAALTPAL